MLGTGLDIMHTGRTAWWQAPAYQAIEEGSGVARLPAAIACFRLDRHAITNRDAVSIAASSADALTRLQPGGFSSLFNFTRAGPATYHDQNGQLQVAATDIPRMDYSNGKRQLLLEGAATNSIRNNTMLGAMSGVVGSGGAAPTNWTTFATGLACTIGNPGIIDGVDCVDIRFQGTTGDANGIVVAFEGQQVIAAATGESWSVSAWLALIAGSLANVTAARIAIREGASGGTLVIQQNSADLRSQLGVVPKRLNYATVLSGGATTAYVQPRIHITVGAGVALDFTLRIGLPQCEKSQLPTSAIRTAGSAATRAADSCQFGAKALALLGRASVGLVVRGQGLWGGSGALVGGDTSQRVIGFNSGQTAVQLGNASPMTIVSGLTSPLGPFGTACGWDGAGKAGSHNGSAIATSATPQDATFTSAYLGRGSGFANGWYDELVLYPFRPSSAALVSKSAVFN